MENNEASITLIFKAPPQPRFSPGTLGSPYISLRLPAREASGQEFRSAMSEPDPPLTSLAHLAGRRWRAAIMGALLLRRLATTLAGGRSAHHQRNRALATRKGQSTSNETVTAKFTSQQLEDCFVNSNRPAVFPA